MIRHAAATLAATLTLAALPAAAQEGGLSFELGAGVGVAPAYPGSDEARVGPDLSFGYLEAGPVRFGRPGLDRANEGLTFRGSFRLLGERSADEFPELAGLDDVPLSVELGGGLEYSADWWEAFAVARYGVVGHGALVGEVGMDVVARPSDRLDLRAGPRLFLASDDFAATYFGVTPDEAAASAFDAFDAQGGILSSGVEASATYLLGDAWGLTASARYDVLQQDAAESPITETVDQWSASIGVTRRFDFRF